jgi:hypothetical protein
MAGHGLTAEQASKAHTDHLDPSQRLEPARDEPIAPPRAPARHLYIVHNAEPSAAPSQMRPTVPSPAPSKSKGMLDRSVQAQIGRLLRDAFSDVADEPVPDRFVKLLEALEAREKES